MNRARMQVGEVTLSALLDGFICGLLDEVEINRQEEEETQNGRC